MPPATYGFPKQFRLNRPREYERVLRSARYRKSRGPLRIFAYANTMPGARLGLIVGRRAVRRAHERNGLKRVAREVFRTCRERLPAVDVVVQFRGPAGRRELRVWLVEEFSAMVASMSEGRAS